MVLLSTSTGTTCPHHPPLPGHEQHPSNQVLAGYSPRSQPEVFFLRHKLDSVHFLLQGLQCPPQHCTPASSWWPCRALPVSCPLFCHIFLVQCSLIPLVFHFLHLPGPLPSTLAKIVTRFLHSMLLVTFLVLLFMCWLSFLPISSAGL